jgi:hypothetical protein
MTVQLVQVVQRNGALKRAWNLSGLLGEMNEGIRADEWYPGDPRPITTAPVWGIGGPIAKAIAWALGSVHYADARNEEDWCHWQAACGRYIMAGHSSDGREIQFECSAAGLRAMWADGYRQAFLSGTNIVMRATAPGIHVFTREKVPGATLKRGHWVVHNTAWALFRPPYRVYEAAVSYLAQLVPTTVAAEVVRIGLKATWQAWQNHE